MVCPPDTLAPGGPSFGGRAARNRLNPTTYEIRKRCFEALVEGRGEVSEGGRPKVRT